MLLDFFYTLRSAKLPVSVKEYLTLLEALQAGVVGPKSDDGWALDEEFNVDNVTEFNELYLGAAAAILDKYIAEITQAKLGN